MLESLLSGLINSVGDMIGDVDTWTIFPSGIVWGGDIVVRLMRLPVLLSSPVSSV